MKKDVERGRGADLVAAVQARMVAAESRIRPHIRTTPVETSSVFSKRAATAIILKLEHIQHSGSFKARGTHLYLPPYNDLDVIAGQATLGAELMRQDPEIDAIVASSGGGGLVSGVAIGAKSVKPGVAVIGASARNAQTFYRSVAAGHYVKTAERPTLSDGTANALEPGSMTIPIGAAVLDETVLVGEDAIRRTMQRFARTERWMIEGAAALSLAAAEAIGKTGRFRRIGVIICGRSVDPAKLVG